MYQSPQDYPKRKLLEVLHNFEEIELKDIE